MGAPQQDSNLFKKGKIWGVRIKLPASYPRHEYKRLIGSKADAIEDRDRVKKLVRARQPLEPEAHPILASGDLQTLLEEAARAWSKTDPRHVYARRWAEWGGSVGISHITRPRIIEAVRTMEEEGYSAATLRIAVSALKAAFTLAEDTRLLDYNPLARPLKLPAANKREKYLPVEGLFRLMAIMAPYSNMPEFAAITGLRCNEQLGLRWDSMDPDLLYFAIAKTKQEKAHKVFLCDRLSEILNEQRGKNAEWVFPSPTGKRWCYSAFSDKRRAWYREAGLEGFTWHDLRHTAASYALSAGETIASVGSLLGHVNRQHTERYAHLLPHAAQRVTGTIAGYLRASAEA